MAKTPRLPKPNTPRRQEARKRLARGRRKRMRQDFANLFMRNLFGVDLDVLTGKGPLEDRMGIAGKGLDKKIEEGGFDIPALSKPQTVSSIASPSIATLTDQMKSMAAIAKKIGIALETQQNELIKHAVQQKRAAKEAVMESSKGEIATAAASAVQPLSPLSSALVALSKSLEKLDNVVENKQQQQDIAMPSTFGELLLENLGFGDLAEVKKADRIKRGAVPKPDIPGGPKPKGLGGFGKKALLGTVALAAIGGGAAFAGGMFSKPKRREGESAEPVAIPETKQAMTAPVSVPAGEAMASETPTVLTPLARSTEQGAELTAAPKITETVTVPATPKPTDSDAIKQIAAPIVDMGLKAANFNQFKFKGNENELKTIAHQLVYGPKTNIPEELQQVSNVLPVYIDRVVADVYKQAYGVEPEKDPNVGERYPLVNQAVKHTIAEGIQQAVKVEAPTLSVIGAEPSAPAQPVDTTPPAAGQTSVANPAAMAAGGAGASATPVPDQPTTSGVGPAAQVSAVPQGRGAETGAKIAERTMENDMLTMPTQTQSPPSTIPLPASTPTTKSGSVGIGNVPEPSYMSIGSLADHIYFGAAA